MSLLHRMNVALLAATLAACSGSTPTQSAARDARVSGQITSAAGAKRGPIAPVNVLQHHLNPTRDGLYVDPLITQAAAANTHRDLAFDGTVPGQVYAQPLYVNDGPSGTAVLIVVTEENAVVALDAFNGAPVWQSNLGTPVPRSQLPCGNITPNVGITGTPIIDLTARTIYVAAMTTPDGGVTKRQLIFALSLDDGSTLNGWPVDVGATLSWGGMPFNSTVQSQRGALALNQGFLYVPYGGNFGDCGFYRGWVVAVPVDDPANPTAWATDSRAGGTWAPGGLSTDGTSIFAATGNHCPDLGCFGTVSTWSGGEAVIRLGPGASFSGQTTDYFVPSNWQALDVADADVGGAGPVIVDVPGATPSALIVEIGKTGVAYLIDRTDMGGISMGDGTGITGEAVASARVAGSTVITAAATYATASGTHVVFHGTGNGVGCAAGFNLVSFIIGPGDPPTIGVAWCAQNLGRGSPIVTTTDGTSEPVVWTVGAESSNRLHAYDGETGAVIFDGGGPSELMTGVNRFQTPIAVNGRIFVAANNQVYAFSTQQAVCP